MERKQFLKTCTMACLGSSAVTALFTSCGISKTLGGNINGSDLIINISEFQTKSNNQTYYKKYIVINNEVLQYPICVYRIDEQNYSALWMRCTHQGTELQVFGNKLQCPAHGSEFDSLGKILNAPADSNLRSFPVTIINNQLKISLKAI